MIVNYLNRQAIAVFSRYFLWLKNSSSYTLHFGVVVLHHNQQKQTVMKLTNVIATGAVLIAFALTPVVSFAQDKQADKKDIKQDERKEVRNKAQRNRAIKNGHPKNAVKDEKKVQADKKDLHHDRKDLHKDKAAK
jgi:hypothetical protein